MRRTHEVAEVEPDPEPTPVAVSETAPAPATTSTPTLVRSLADFEDDDDFSGPFAAW